MERTVSVTQGTKRSVNMAAVCALRGALFLLLLMGPAAARNAAACSCGANPPCAAVWRADAVFIGTVVDRTAERIGGSLRWTVHKVAVTHALRGSIDPFITLVPGEPPTAERIAASLSSAGEQTMFSSCDYDFQLGRQYVIYARRTADGRWATSNCTGTKPVEDAAADLDYIAGIPLAEPTGRVFGHIERTVPNPRDTTTPITVAATGVSVALTSDTHSLTATTDSEGRLDVQVPPGEYSIAPVVPESVRVYAATRRVTVPARGCAPVSFSLIANGRIEGRVVGDPGRPVPHIRVDVLPVDVPDDKSVDSFTAAPSATTDDGGRFRVDAILPGRYYLAVNGRRGPESTSPYRTTYFPGVTSRDAARVIELGEGERKTGFAIAIKPLVEATVSGFVISEAGEPVADAFVRAAAVDHPRTVIDSARTDANGAFQLRLFGRTSYVIRVGILGSSDWRHTETVLAVDRDLHSVRLTIRR
jgi:hypothetical protein